MEVTNGKSPIWVELKNLKQFAQIKKLLDEEAGDFSTVDITIQKHEGVIVEINHKIKYSVKGKSSFDTSV